MGFEMAEYDQKFIVRIMDMENDDLLAYLHSLSEVERKAMEQAIFRALSQQAVIERINELHGGVTG